MTEPLERYRDAVAHGWSPPGNRRAIPLPVPEAPIDATRRTVPEFSDYEIDRNGRVWSKERYARGGWVGRWLPGRFLTPFMVGTRGPYYSLSNDDGKHTITMAKLLAETWNK